MARPIPILSSHLPILLIPSFYIIITFLAILSIFSLVIFLCASHKKYYKDDLIKNKLTISRKNLLKSLSKVNNFSNKALLNMVSWRKQDVQHRDDHDDYYDINNYDNHDYFVVNDDGFIGENAVWKKTIIKGEKCKPLQFSGKIEYDSEGNLLNGNHKIVGNDKNKVISSNNKEVIVS